MKIETIRCKHKWSFDLYNVAQITNENEKTYIVSSHWNQVYIMDEIDFNRSFEILNDYE